MNELQQHIVEFQKELDTRGMNKLCINNLSRFVAYVESMDLSYLSFKVKDAEAFLNYITTCRSNKGTLLSRSYIHKILIYTFQFYEFLRKRKLIYRNPFKDIQKGTRKAKTLPRNLLDETKMHALLAHLRNFSNCASLREKKQMYKTHVVAELMYSTGARINEIVKLTTLDIDLTRGVILLTDTKSGHKKEGILNSYAEKVLHIYLTIRPLLLTSAKDNRKYPDLLFGSIEHICKCVNRTLAIACETIGLPKQTSHAIRHMVGYHLLRGGCDIRYIQDILGHRKLSSTQIYTKIDKEDLRSVLDEYHPRSGIITREAV